MKREFLMGFVCYVLWRPVVLALEVVTVPAANTIENVVTPGRFERSCTI